MLVKSLAGVCGLALMACASGGSSSAQSAKAAGGIEGVREGGVYEVLDASGRAFVPLGEAHRTPARRGPPTVVSQGVAVEFADERKLDEPPEITVVDSMGTCVTRASSRLLIGRYEGNAARWLDAVELDGCTGDPALKRLALIGAASAARWISPQEAVFVDGQLTQAAELLEGQLDGKKILRQYHFPGSDLVLESEYVAPSENGVPLRMMRGKHLLATYPGASVAGAVDLVERLLIVLDGGGLIVVEIVGDQPVTLLSPPAAPRVD